jgi:hypothetical protein
MIFVGTEQREHQRDQDAKPHQEPVSGVLLVQVELALVTPYLVFPLSPTKSFECWAVLVLVQY